MNKKTVQVFSLLCFCFFPIRVLSQCTDHICQNLEIIATAAKIDFREYRQKQTPGPDISTSDTRVACQMNTWANNVPTYMCYAQVASANAESWYATVLGALQRLEPAWRFQISSPNGDHYVDAGPEGCEIPPDRGPYIGQCPLHLQTVTQKDGTVRLHYWMNSLSSPYLFPRPPDPAPKTVPHAEAGICDDFCQKLKKALAARMTSFADIQAAKTNGEKSDVEVKLDGATECLVNRAIRPHSTDVGEQFVCYWSESSGPSAKARFLDLVSRIQNLLPSNWSTDQKKERDDLTGANITAWYAVEPGGKYDVRIYFSGQDVSLHITTWTEQSATTGRPEPLVVNNRRLLGSKEPALLRNQVPG
jgi:hypothetical protein